MKYVERNYLKNSWGISGITPEKKASKMFYGAVDGIVKDAHERAFREYKLLKEFSKHLQK